MKDIKVSDYLHFHQVDEGRYVGWNRFFPSIFILNKGALKLLDHIRAGKPLETNETIDRFLAEFKKFRFIYEGDSDPSREDFLAEVRKRKEAVELKVKEFVQTKKDYSTFRLTNDVCNLGCSYCVNRYRDTKNRVKTSAAEKQRVLDDCVDQYMARKVSNGGADAAFFFNGGEILMDWDLIKKTVQRNERKYPDIKVKYEINTNLTRLTEEIARFFQHYDFKVNISIDGYKEAHDRTRVYHDGKGSFDDIMEKVELYRKISKKPLNIFQGTIEHIGEFEPEEVYKMAEYGFTSARLAPNLLGASEQDAREKAGLMGRFLELNAEYSFQVAEMFFDRANGRINDKGYWFHFYCAGLGDTDKLSFDFNISTFRAAYLCGFAGDATVPLADLDYDIYHPKLWQVSSKYMDERIKSLEENCMECSLAGLCSGGCVMSGLDKQNRLNKAACVYQREMWNIYLQKVYRDRKPKS
jgi:uncharacterized protein